MWMEYVRVIWPIASTLTPLLIGFALFWLRNQFALKTELAARAAELAAHNALQDDKLAGHETRIVILERECASPPTRHNLNERLGQVAERLSSLESGVAGLNTQAQTSNDYLQALVNEGIRR